MTHANTLKLDMKSTKM